MAATAKLREFLKSLKDGEMFAAIDVTNLDKRRKSVYGALARLNQNGEIFRVAWGLYIKGDENTPRPTAAQIAHAKARAFRKTITEISTQFAQRMGIEFAARAQAVFATNGRSSVIRSCHGPIQFIGASLRKIALQDSPVGVQLRTVWHLGRNSDPAPFIQHAARLWSGRDWDEGDARCTMLPYWLAAMLALPISTIGMSQARLE